MFCTGPTSGLLSEVLNFSWKLASPSRMLAANAFEWEFLVVVIVNGLKIRQFPYLKVNRLKQRDEGKSCSEQTCTVHNQGYFRASV